MNYYKRHLGDIAKATAHLTMIQDGAYNRLMDHYYAREGPIPDADVLRLTRAKSKSEIRAVRSILKEFFKLSRGRWVHTRCDEEIAKLTKNAKNSQNNGSKGGRPKTQQVPEKNPVGFSREEKNNLTPLATTPLATTPLAITPQATIPPTPTDADDGRRKNNPPPGFLRFWQAWPRHERKASREQCVKIWLRSGCEEISDRIVATVEALKKSRDWMKDSGQFIPAPKAWLNQGRWDVETDAITTSSTASGEIPPDNDTHTQAELDAILGGDNA